MMLRFLKDEDGQATVEYVIFLVVVIGALFAVWGTVRSRIEALFTNIIGERFLRRRFFNPANMYSFTLGR